MKWLNRLRQWWWREDRRERSLAILARFGWCHDLEFRHYLKHATPRWMALSERKLYQLEEKYNTFDFPATKRELSDWVTGKDWVWKCS